MLIIMLIIILIMEDPISVWTLNDLIIIIYFI
jgi:hypothetical protein